MEMPLKNGLLRELKVDHLYHLGLDTSMNLKEMFGDTKFVCMQGSAERTLKFANYCLQHLKVKIPVGCSLAPIGKTERYSLYKVGPVISVNHGMGAPSLSILLHEVTKLLSYAGATNVIYIRIGTSGGLGLEGGSVVISEECLNGELLPFCRQYVLGKEIRRSTKLNETIAKEIYDCKGDIQVTIGKTMSCDDFYEGQARLDGAICEHTEEQKLAFLKEAYEKGVRNIEMEGLGFASFCSHLGIRSAILCVVLLNRLKGDQVTSTSEELADYSDRAQRLTINYIKKVLQI